MRALCLLALAGCGALTPAARSLGASAPEFVGEPVTTAVSWDARCFSLGVFMDDLASKSGHTSDYSDTCRDQRFRVHVECSLRCEVPANGSVVFGRAIVEVIPLEPGRLSLAVTLTRDDGEARTFEVPSAIVTMPDALSLQCWNGGAAATCEPRGVPASAAFVTPVPFNTAMRINGWPVRDASRPIIPLAELFPAARLGTGVRPGTYPITLELGGVKTRWDVVAR